MVEMGCLSISTWRIKCTTMVNKIQAAARLYLLVFIMSFFIIGIGVYGILEIKAMNRNTETLYADRVIPMEQLANVRYAYAVGIISAAERARTHHLTYTEAGKQVLKAQETITTRWTAYLLTYLTPEEKLMARQASVLMEHSTGTIEKLKDMLNKEEGTALDTLINTALYPAINPVIAKINELFDLQVSIGKGVYKNSTAAYNSSLKKFVLLIILCLAIAIPFSYYLVRSVKELIKDIAASNEKIAESEAKYRNIFENVQDAFYQTSLEGIILDVSPSIKYHTGYSREEMIGTYVVDFYYDPADRDKGIKMLIEEGELTDYEFRLKSKTGEPVYVSMNARLIAGADGNTSHIDGVLRNIADRKKAEESIKQSEANYRQLFEFSPAPMWLFDEQTHLFMQVNQACINHYGYSQEEFAGMTITNINLQNDETDMKDTPPKKNQGNHFYTGGQRHLKKSGEVIDVETSSIPVLLNGKKQILMVAIDVTEKNRYEQQITRAAIKAQEDERYEIGGELHDNICQILATSLLLLAMMKNTVPAASKENFDKIHEYLALAMREIRNLSHRLAPAFFDDATLEDAFNNLLINFNIEQQYAIKMDFDRRLKNYPLSRDLQLNVYRILQEQLRNIFKHANANSIEVAVAMNNNNTLQMRIADNGVGFDAEAGRGGIGLASMSRRVQLFSGNFTVHSSIGNGCEVLVEIPLPVSS